MKLPMVKSGVMRNGVSSTIENNSGILPSGWGSWLCEKGCDATEWAAKKACDLLPVGSDVCKSAATAAGDWCRSKC